MKKRLGTLLLIITLLTSFSIQPVFAKYQPELPSLYQTFNDYFMFGSFESMSSFFGGGDPQNMLHQHYNSWSPSNEFKPSALFSANVSASVYNTAVNATYATEEEKAAAIDKANKTVSIASTTSQKTFLDRVRALNETRDDDNKVKVKAHTLLWHNMTPEQFFHDGFVNSGAWASREVMLARIDSYIKGVFTEFKDYDDLIYSWDVVNEAIDCFTGYIRNDTDYQLSNWGRIFKRPDLTGEERILAESEYIRQAFESASKYNKEMNLGLTLVYNDFHDADKPYEPKVPATVTMLKPIYEQMKQDGTTFVVGMQNRNAVSLDMQVFKDAFNAFAEVCDEIQFTESDTRTDLVANPNYSPDVLPYYLEDGTKNPEWTWSAWQNTPDAHVALVPSDWQAAWANREDLQKQQADWQADQFEFLLENSKGNGGKLSMYAFDGLSDTRTFNARKGAHIFMSADNAGNEDYTAKMSYYAMVGSVPRFELKKALENVPEESSKDNYTPDSWDRYAEAVEAAEEILEVGIYDLEDVNNVKDAMNELTDSIADLTDVTVSLSEIKIDNVVFEDFAPGTHEYNVTVPVGKIPQVAAKATNGASKVEVDQAEELPGQAVITVTSDDKEMTYTINFNVDTTLEELLVDGVLVNGFNPTTYTYDVAVPYGTVPQVTVVPNDLGIAPRVNQATAVPGQAIVEVEVGSAKTIYTINFSVDSTLKALKVNGIDLEGFNPNTYAYRAIVPKEMVTIPQVSAATNDPNAPMSITQAENVPGQAAITVGIGESQVTYTVTFTKNATGNDEFNDTTLDLSKWHWINEDPTTWSLTSNPGSMTIASRAGDIYQGSDDAKNILLQDAPGDWTIETKLTCSVTPNSTYQQGGLIALQDLDNYIKLDWESQGNNRTVIQVCREVNGQPTATSITATSLAIVDNTLWFRMAKSGNSYSVYYSLDGETFTQLGTNFTLNFKDVQTGIYANNGSGTATDMDVMFDYFHSDAVLGVLLPVEQETEDEYTISTEFNLDKLEAGRMLTSKVTAKNVNSDITRALVIVALYEGNKMINVSFISKDLPKGASETLSAGFKLPSTITTDHKVKVFVWDGTSIDSSNGIPLSKVTVLQ